MTSDGELNDVKILEDMETEIKYNDSYCDLEEGKTYYFITSVNKAPGEDGNCSISFIVRNLDEFEIGTGYVEFLDSEGMLSFTAPATGKYIVSSENPESTGIFLYDEKGAVTAVGMGSVIFSADKGSTYRIACPDAEETQYITISRYKKSISALKFTKPSGTFTYTGKSIRPKVKLTEADYVLVSGTDYTVSYSNCINAGTASVTLEGKGNYSGTLKASYKINKAANPLRIKAKTAVVKRSKVKKKAQKLAVSKVISFTRKGKGALTFTKLSGSKKITINKKTGTVTAGKGLKKGTYTVKVKVKAAGTANYKASGWKTVKFKVRVK